MKLAVKFILNQESCSIRLGILVGEIIDSFKPSNELSPNIAITDISAVSHILM